MPAKKKNPKFLVCYNNYGRGDVDSVSNGGCATLEQAKEIASLELNSRSYDAGMEVLIYELKGTAKFKKTPIEYAEVN